MWTRLDDALIDHQKLFAAGDLIGRNGAAIALGFYAVGLMWANKHLSDGHLPAAVVRRWTHVEQPMIVARALVTVNLWEQNGDGFIVHDFPDHNLLADEVQVHREGVSKIRSAAGRIGGLKSGEARRQRAKQREANASQQKQSNEL